MRAALVSVSYVSTYTWQSLYQLVFFWQTEAAQKIQKFESESEKLDGHSLELGTVRGNMEEKKEHLKKLLSAIAAAKYDVQIADKSSKIQDLERQREAVNSEMKALNSQGNSRAKLELKRGEVRTKTAEIKQTLVHSSFLHRCSYIGSVDKINVKFRAIMKKDVKAETVVDDVDSLLA